EGDVWTDLDPTGLEALPGQALGVTAETMAVPEISALPSELRHAVTVRVVVECSVAGALQEFVLVESPALLPAEVLGRRIVINHVPARSSRDSFSVDDPARLTGVLEQEKWFPVLTVGESQTYTSAFTDSCVIDEAAPPWLGEAVQGAFQGAADVLGGLGEAPASAETTDHVTAQWLEYQIEVPGQPTRLVRRQVFDLLGVTDREAGLASFAPTQEDELRWRLALLGETEILIVG